MGFNIRGSMNKWVYILVALVVGVPILTVIFAANGPFAGLNTLVGTSGMIGGTASTYQPIIAAVVGLIPLGVLVYFAVKFVSGRMSSRKRAKSRKKTSARRRRASTARMQPVILAGGRRR